MIRDVASDPEDDYTTVALWMDAHGIIHEVSYLAGWQAKVRCTRRIAGDIWNPEHPSNADKPNFPTCLACMTAKDV